MRSSNHRGIWIRLPCRTDQRHHAFICNGFRHIAACDHLGKALHNRGFTYPRFTDQAGIIFRSSAQDLDNTLDLTFPGRSPDPVFPPGQALSDHG